MTYYHRVCKDGNNEKCVEKSKKLDRYDLQQLERQSRFALAFLF